MGEQTVETTAAQRDRNGVEVKVGDRVRWPGRSNPERGRLATAEGFAHGTVTDEDSGTTGNVVVDVDTTPGKTFKLSAAPRHIEVGAWPKLEAPAAGQVALVGKTGTTGA